MLVLHTYFRSSAAYRVRIALELKGLPYTAAPVHLLRNGGEQHAAGFAQINPAELVPVLQDGTTTLSQSMAIIEYLEERYPDTPALLPTDPAGRAQVRAIALSIACEIHPLNNLRVLQHLESTLGMDAVAKKAWMVHWIAVGFTAVEAMLVHTAGTFSFGGTPSLADCYLVPQLYNAERFGVALDAYPTLCRVGEACRQLPAFQRAAPEVQSDAA